MNSWIHIIPPPNNDDDATHVASLDDATFPYITMKNFPLSKIETMHNKIVNLWKLQFYTYFQKKLGKKAIKQFNYLSVWNLKQKTQTAFF
jgi:hypothetical protein